MINKVVASCEEAVGDIFEGAAIAFGGFVGTGYAVNLIEALQRKGTKNLTAILTWGSWAASRFPRRACAFRGGA